MRIVAVERTIAAPASAAWELLAGTRHWPAWGPTVIAVEPEDAVVAPGLQGRVRTPVGLWVPFEVTEVEAGRRWAWRVAGVPATAHRVEPLGEASCRVAIDVPVVAAPYAAVCALALRRLERLLP